MASAIVSHRTGAGHPPTSPHLLRRRIGLTITLVTEEKLGQLADGVTYNFWTFNGTVPGPFIRLRLNQTVEVHIVNLAE